MQPPVPKFSSFRSKTSLAASGNGQVRSASNQDHSKAPQEAPRKLSKTAEEAKPARQGRHSTYEHPSRYNAHDHRKHSEAELPQSQHYVIDRKGDPGNRVYGTNAKHSLPEYRSPSSKWLLGNSAANASGPMSQRSLLSNLERTTKLGLRAEGRYIAAISQAPTADTDNPPKDFLSLGFDTSFNSSLPEDRHNDQAESGIEMLRTDSGLESNLETPDSDSAAPFPEPPLVQANRDLTNDNAQLLERIKTNPGDVQNWLKFIDFQGRWARQGLDSGGVAPTELAEQRSIAEVRISLYEDALSQVSPDDDERELLLLGLLKEGQKTWPIKKLISKWQDITSRNETCLRVQLEYLNFLQTSNAAFTYERCLEQYGKYIQLLSQNSKLSAHDRAVHQIYGLLRLASLARDAGYTEFSRSLWQSSFEISCFVPEYAQGSREDILNAFEEFWENEVPRIGEEHSRGWYESSGAVERVSGQGSPSGRKNLPPVSQDADPISLWLSREQKSTSFWAGRTKEDCDQEEDPYRVVFFSDLKPFIFKILPEHQHLLIDAFLCYHQLPRLSGLQTSPSQSWWLDSFLRPGQPEHQDAFSYTDMTNSITSTDSLFFNFDQTRSALCVYNDWSAAKRETLEFVCNVFRALVKVIPEDDNIAEYLLAVDSLIQPLRARKMAKTILRRHPVNFTIYNAYALTESRLGNSDESNRVFSTAISLGASMASSERLGTILLYRTWVWQALRLHDTTLALERLAKIALTADDIKPLIERYRDAALQQSLFKLASLASELLAIRSYLGSDDSKANLAAALKVFAMEARSLLIASSDSSAVEMLHQAQAQLISYHMSQQRAYSPRLIRDALRSSITSFPNNTILLSLYAENEQRFRIDDRIRQVTRDVLMADGKGSIVTWHFALRTELKRCVADVAGTTSHAVRATFERAISSEAGRHNVSLWTAYVLWETEVAKVSGSDNQRHSGVVSDTHQRDMKKAFNVWLRGLNALPWVKQFVELGLDKLRYCMTLEQCSDFVAMMRDRGIRLHTDLDTGGMSSTQKVEARGS